MRWHLYCRVVDNFGDVGVAWRLAADLASRGEVVRLAVDDPRALEWMAPGGAAGVEVCAWSDPPAPVPDVVLELFGAGLPDAVEAAICEAPRAPLVVNVEHLSAEGYVVRSHGLPSPRRTARGLPFTTWYFYPGFTEGTGGLVREPGLIERRESFDAKAWLGSIGIEARPGERRVGLFCYEASAVASLLEALQGTSTLVLLAHGAATEQVGTVLGPSLALGTVRAVALPRHSQPDFDRLLWSCELNFVRGEDSLVRAIHAGAPFVWQLYVQADGAHRVKLAAFLDLFLAGAPAELGAAVRRIFENWNDGSSGSVDEAVLAPSSLDTWATHVRRWRGELARHEDLVTRLLRFAASNR